jgi:hypothetical protein
VTRTEKRGREEAVQKPYIRPPLYIQVVTDKNNFDLDSAGRGILPVGYPCGKT